MNLDLAGQVRKLRHLGFEGLKVFAGKPSFQGQLDLKLSDPVFVSAFKEAERLGLKVLIHVADPPVFWSSEGVSGYYRPLWAGSNGEKTEANPLPGYEELQNQALTIFRSLSRSDRHLPPATDDGPRFAAIFSHPGDPRSRLSRSGPGAVLLRRAGSGPSGGFTTVAWIRRSKELFLRWMELGACSLQLRSHEGNRPERNWQFDSDSETLHFVARMTGVFNHLKGYRLHYLKEYQRSGLPVIRHPYLHYEGDSVLHTLKYQYLLGRDLLVAPVISPRRRKWLVFYRKESPFRETFEAIRREFR